MNTASQQLTLATGGRARLSEAWTAFWEDRTQSRCAAGAREISRALMRHWSLFSRSLPHGTRVLDLGCGAGVVGRTLLEARVDLHVTGIDSATVPSAARPQYAAMSKTAMECLPFTSTRFGAAVSQYGYEYSQTGATAREVARVLVPGAPLSFLVHHAESAIVAATRIRLESIRLLLGRSMCAAFCSGDAAALQSQMSELVAKHPNDALALQLARLLPQRLMSPPAKRVAIWMTIEEALAPERCVSESLDACCVAPSQIGEWLEPLRSVCRLKPVSVLQESNGDPVAWIVEGTR